MLSFVYHIREHNFWLLIGWRLFSNRFDPRILFFDPFVIIQLQKNIDDRLVKSRTPGVAIFPPFTDR